MLVNKHRRVAEESKGVHQLEQPIAERFSEMQRGNCVVCGREIPFSLGRPRRYCSDECKRLAKARRDRIRKRLLRRLVSQRYDAEFFQWSQPTLYSDDLGNVFNEFRTPKGTVGLRYESFNEGVEEESAAVYRHNGLQFTKAGHIVVSADTRAFILNARRWCLEHMSLLGKPEHIPASNPKVHRIGVPESFFTPESHGSNLLDGFGDPSW